MIFWLPFSQSLLKLHQSLIAFSQSSLQLHQSLIVFSQSSLKLHQSLIAFSQSSLKLHQSLIAFNQSLPEGIKATMVRQSVRSRLPKEDWDRFGFYQGETAGLKSEKAA